MHPALLPRFRGADPIQAAPLAEATATGVTYHHAVPEVDAWNILIQRTYPIATDETNPSLRFGLDGWRQTASRPSGSRSHRPKLHYDRTDSVAAADDPPIDEERQIVWEKKGVRLVLTLGLNGS